jgi:glyceraldehyde-3-phosphate dehydrogenase/erythrose-4-phosphate dehydrogenase
MRRVPVPNGSLVILNLEVSEKTSIVAINAIMKKYALEAELVEQIKYSTNNELVSSYRWYILQFMTVMPQSFLMTVKYSVIHMK